MQRSWARRLVRRILRTIVRLLALLLLRFEVRGREHLPAGGPLIVIANHFGWLEPALLPTLLPYEIEYLAAENMYHHPAVGWVFYSYGAVPVRRGEVDRQALRGASRVLAGGGVLAIFPEGGVRSSRFRSALIPPRPGTAYLAVQHGVSILPIGFSGSGADVFGYWRRLRRAPVVVTIGEPFGPLVAAGHGAARRQALDEASELIMQRIAALLPMRERGPYAGVEDGGQGLGIGDD